ncbi:C2H2-type domain-containing protein [Mycena indigotica]|uniref:C2H2-type domain-containing protein n=1 Tax=Mycena indigotica TaxID=2126181 RepID=A0A8H6W6F5_9AGAR|nr:C2H2-type domain-containing protein [Mycena indigotica]KAF7303363.1 C2H2-type domain-containing protein [Mycena indigotica]
MPPSTLPQDTLRRRVCPHPGCNARPRTARALTYHLRSIHGDTIIQRTSTIDHRSTPSPEPNEVFDFGEPDTIPASPPPPPAPFFGDKCRCRSSTRSTTEASIPHRCVLCCEICHDTDYPAGRPCNANGDYLPPGTPPPPRTAAEPNDWSPYNDEVRFELADLLFRKQQSSQKHITELLRIWAIDRQRLGAELGPFRDYQEIYDTIDSTLLGDAPWKCLVMDPLTDDASAPTWARRSYEVWYRDPATIIKNMLDNPAFDGAFDTAPYIHLDADGKRRWHDFMSANFAYRHSTTIYESDPSTEGGDLYHASLAKVLESLKPGMTTPIVLRCPDGHYRRAIYDFGLFIADYPEQVMLACIVQNWCAKCSALATELDGDIGVRRTKARNRELISIYDGDQKTLWDSYGMNIDVIPFTQDFPRADIHEMLSPDLLHQMIKGTFKDHLVTWVGEYLYLTHPPAVADGIMDEIDRRIAAVPGFPGLRRFKDGRRFSQWTGDDSKALMKVYLPAIKGLVPDPIVLALRHFLDFCYLVRRSDFNEDSLAAIEQTVIEFHRCCEVFRQLGVREEFSLPRQHSMKHYGADIREFGAPNGVCSSMTESRHITAVKEPWRRSSRFEALGQMLLTNQRLDKLTASRADFVERGMLVSEVKDLPDNRTLEDDKEEDVSDELRVDAHVLLARTRDRSYPQRIHSLAEHTGWRQLPQLVQAFLEDQLYDGRPPTAYNSDSDDDIDVKDLTISVFHSAVASFYAPSDISGIRGMRREWIRSTPRWRGSGQRRDCVYVVEDEASSGFRGMSVVRVQLLFSFIFDAVTYPCALVEWFKKVGRSPDPTTGMWLVEPEQQGNSRLVTVVHLDSVLRGAHLIPVFGERRLPIDFQHTYSLDSFQSFHVNKYIDHHANEILF